MNSSLAQICDVKASLFLEDRKWAELPALERLTLVLIILTPVFFLSIRHWISNVSVLAALLCMVLIYRQRVWFPVRQVPHIKTMALLFSAYAIGIVISQLGRHTLVTREYLDQTRWLVGLPFFVVLIRYQINYTSILKTALPVSIFAAWLGLTFFPSDAWGGRETISFIDPLTFGHLNLTLGLMCFVAALFDVAHKKVILHTVFNLGAFAVGVLLSVKSGSRTGWLAVPLVLCLVFYQIYKPAPGKLVLMILSIFAALFLFVRLNADLAARFSLLANELISYPWHGGLAPDTSVGMRMTFYRLGYYYFSQSPLFGWGNRGYADIKDAAEVLAFSSQYTRDFAMNSMFHSDLTTQAVRYGVFGLASVLIVFLVPLTFFVRALRAGDDLKKVACLGLTFTLCQLGSSLSTEVYDSKGVTTFTAVILAGLLAEIFSRQAQSGHLRRSS